MDDEKLRASFDCFGLTPKATMHEVEKTFRELRNLYSEEALATYSLLEDTERQQKLESLQMAYDQILQFRQQASAAGKDFENTETPEASGKMIIVDANPQQAPGLFLKQTRMAGGVSLREVAERTKIGTFHLKSIEEQHFEALPAPVYLRGFLREMTRMLMIKEADALIENFMVLYLSHQQH
jgi:flagellar biosynthesis protein FlhG